MDSIHTYLVHADDYVEWCEGFTRGARDFLTGVRLATQCLANLWELQDENFEFPEEDPFPPADAHPDHLIIDFPNRLREVLQRSTGSLQLDGWLAAGFSGLCRSSREVVQSTASVAGQAWYVGCAFREIWGQDLVEDLGTVFTALHVREF